MSRLEAIGEVKNISISKYKDIYKLIKEGWIYLDSVFDDKSEQIFVFLGLPRKK
jgi:hypothetical protein